VETVLDGANLSYYQTLPMREELKKELELPLDKTIVTYTGATMLNKGIQYLLDAIPQVLEKTNNVYFVIAGFPIEDVEKFVKDNHLGEHVRIVSPLSYFFLPKLLCASDIGVDPKDSQVRQASGKILQYMAAGLPVVCFDRPNNREYLAEGGVYAQDISANALAEKIVECIANKNEMQKKGEFNRMRAQQFSWNTSTEQIEKIYQRIK